jgi:hypothetical protein
MAVVKRRVKVQRSATLSVGYFLRVVQALYEDFPPRNDSRMMVWSSKENRHLDAPALYCVWVSTQGTHAMHERMNTPALLWNSILDNNNMRRASDQMLYDIGCILQRSCLLIASGQT